MSYKLVFTVAAERDLERIIAYISEKLKNKTAAKNLYKQFDQQTRALTKQPRLYNLSGNRFLAARGYRKMTLYKTNYFVMYKIDEETKAVVVMRVFYTKQDYETLI